MKKPLLFIITIVIVIFLSGCQSKINNIEDIKMPKIIDELGLTLGSYTYSSYVGPAMVNDYPGLGKGERIRYEYVNREGMIPVTASITKFNNIELGQKEIIEEGVYTSGMVIPAISFKDDYVSSEEIINGKTILRFTNKNDNIEYKIYPTYVWNDGIFIYVVKIENEKDINLFLSKTGLINQLKSK